MRYFIISPTGIGMFMVPRLAISKQVEKVYFYLINSDVKQLGKNMNQVMGWEKLEVVFDMGEVLNTVPKNDLTIIIDDVGIGELASNLRKQGYKVVGGSPLTDKIEEERQFATDLMSRIMNVPESASFQSWERAIEFVKNNEPEDKLVFKPNDSFAPKEYTYVSKDIKDMVDRMKEFRSEWKWKEDFQIQRFVKGIEVDFSAYIDINGNYIKNSMMIYFENKPIMNDDVGPASGGAIAVEFARDVQGEFGDILNKLRPALKKSGYIGQISCNSIVSEEDHKPYFLEFCGRFGYPSLPLDISLLEDNDKTFHDLCQTLVTGDNKNLFPTDKVAVTLSVGVPPYPMKEGVEKTRGVSMEWDRKYDEYFFPYFPMYEKGKICMAGLAGDAVNITCVDEKLDGAVSMLYEDYLPTLKLKYAMYRTDLGDDARKRIKAIKEWGLIS